MKTFAPGDTVTFARPFRLWPSKSFVDSVELKGKSFRVINVSNVSSENRKHAGHPQYVTIKVGGRNETFSGLYFSG